MARGVYLDVRHAAGCPRYGASAKDRREPYDGARNRRCLCAPSVYAQVKGTWLPGRAGVLPEDWTRRDLQVLEREGLGDKLNHESGRRLVRVDAAPVLRDVAERWLGEIERRMRLGEYSPNTHVNYQSMWRHIAPCLGELRITPTELSDGAIAELRAELAAKGLSEKRVQQVLRMLATLLADEAVPRWLDYNPAQDRRKRRGRGGGMGGGMLPRARALPLDVVRDLLTATRDSNPLLHDMILCAVTTGMRKREVAGLKWSAIDLRARLIEVRGQRVAYTHEDRLPKSAKPRLTVICGTLADRLSARAEHATGEWVFPSARGVPWASPRQGKQLADAWDKLGTRGEREGWHSFRHTFSTTLLRGGINDTVADALMGHGKRDVAATYRHVTDEDFAAVVDLFDRHFPTAVPESAEVATARA